MLLQNNYVTNISLTCALLLPLLAVNLLLGDTCSILTQSFHTISTAMLSAHTKLVSGTRLIITQHNSMKIDGSPVQTFPTHTSGSKEQLAFSGSNPDLRL